MMQEFNNILKREGITEYAVIDFDKLSIINPRLIKPSQAFKSALIVLIPYRHKNVHFLDRYNVGLFARCKDYHQYAKQLFERLIPKFENAFSCEVCAFADHSPINEKDAAQKAGLGFIGKNGLLINKKYGSYIFIAEFLFTKRLNEALHECTYTCLSCDECIRSCPVNALSNCTFERAKCVSSISQKKTKNEDEKFALYTTRTVWGCDLCQSACPYNRNAAYSEIDYFKNDIILDFSNQTIHELSDEEYNHYAFSFRPRSVIAENFLTVNGKYDIIDKQL